MKPEVVVATLLALILAVLALLSPPGAAFLERVLRESPEARVADYVRAVARGDEQAAEAVWKLSPSLPGGSIEALQERRRAVTHELATQGLRPTFEVVHTE